MFNKSNNKNINFKKIFLFCIFSVCIFQNQIFAVDIVGYASPNFWHHLMPKYAHASTFGEMASNPLSPLLSTLIDYAKVKDGATNNGMIATADEDSGGSIEFDLVDYPIFNDGVDLQINIDDFDVAVKYTWKWVLDGKEYTGLFFTTNGILSLKLPAPKYSAKGIFSMKGRDVNDNPVAFEYLVFKAY